MKILVDNKGKKFLAKDQDLHTDAGYIKKEVIAESEVGDILETHLGKKYAVIDAKINDYIDLMDRRCSIILPKDLGLVAAYTGLGNGHRVLEAGTGAGAATIFLANIVGPEGHVTTFEVREDFAEIAKKNIEGYGLKNVELRCEDVNEPWDFKDLDLIFFDLPQPWIALEQVFLSLKCGGFLAAYNPFLEQVQTLHKVLKKVGFRKIETVECMVRGLEVKSRGTRPNTRMTGHTGYLTFARKL